MTTPNSPPQRSSPATGAAPLDSYRADLREFFQWAHDVGVAPLDATRAHIELYRTWFDDRGLAPSTIDRRLSTVCGYYRFAHIDGRITANPAQYVRRPRVHPTAQRGMDRGELASFLYAAERTSPMHAALAVLLGLNGLRVSEACGANIDDLGFERGHRTLQIIGKGNKPAGIPLVPRTARTIDLAIAERGVGRDDDGRAAEYSQSGYWLGAAGYLMLVDQLSTMLEGGIEALLTSELGGLTAEEAGAICGLRNAFLHSYGLSNDPTKMQPHCRKLLRHVFRLQAGTDRLVDVGDRTDVLSKRLADRPPTFVDLRRLGDLVEGIVASVRERHLARRNLNWLMNEVDEFVGQCIFTHLVPVEES
ncbi:MAG: integrase [Ilumatobacteraceae bacterium]|nr:integrase [Ilumatobacteraceae bacterium]